MPASSSPSAHVVATVDSPPSDSDLQALPSAVRWLEITSPGIDARQLRKAGFKLIRGFGVDRDLAPSERRSRLAAEAGRFDLVVLRGEDFSGPAVHIPAEKRLLEISRRENESSAEVDAIEREILELLEIPARLYRWTEEIRQPTQALPMLFAGKKIARNDLAVFALGGAGFWTRLAARGIGDPRRWGPLTDEPADRVPVARLVRDFGLPELHFPTDLYGIVGGSVLRSLSPRLHRSAYGQLGIEACYWPFNVDDLEAFWRVFVMDHGFESLGLSPHGFTVVAPHKQKALGLVGVEAETREIRRHGGNILKRTDNGWRLDSSDPVGVLGPLALRGIDPTGLSAAVLGCGGAGRAAVASLREAGAEVTLINRHEGRGRAAANELGVPFLPLKELHSGLDDLPWSVFVSAIPSPKGPPENYLVPSQPASTDPPENYLVPSQPVPSQPASTDPPENYLVPSQPASTDPPENYLVPSQPVPFDLRRLPPAALIIDYVYGSQPTPLVDAARRLGLQVADGFEVLLIQSRRQIESLTGHPLELQELRRMLHRP